jgi:S-disulfanyl-L-cysteine oxidoreductase SoxD
MFTPKGRYIAVIAALILGTSAAFAQSPNLGVPISSADIAAWDIVILPDGTGLPPGNGTAAQGAPIYAEKCALCHGINAEGGIAVTLTGGSPLTNGIDTAKTIANFWPVSTTLFDYIRRAMPWTQPRTLTDQEVYALTAYVLAINDIIDDADEMNAETLPRVQMPNSDGFIVRFPTLTP